MEEKLFVRKKSGLRKEWSPFDAFVFNLLFGISITHIGGILIFSLMAAFCPGGIPVAALAISASMMFFVVMCYALMTASMPRAGANYVWMSRIINPAFGYVIVLSMTIALVGWFTNEGIKMAEWVLPGGLTYLGLSNLVSVPLQPFWIVVITVVMLLVALLVNALGMRVMARYLRVLLGVTLAGLVVTLILLIITPNATFINVYNSFMLSKVGPNAFQRTIETAKALGYGSTTFQWSQLLPMTFWGALMYTWTAGSFIHSSEVKGIERLRTTLRSFIGAFVITTAILMMLWALIPRTFSWEFLGSISYLFFTGHTALLPTFWPFFLWFVVPLAGVFTFIVGILLLAMSAVSGMYFTILDSAAPIKYIFSMSFDQVLPRKLSEVHSKTGAPIYASLLVGVAALVWVGIAQLWPAAFSIAILSGTMTTVELIMHFGVCLTCILFPWRAKHVYEASPIAKYKVGKVPLITILGAFGAAFMLFIISVWGVFSVFGVTVTTFVTTIEIFVIAAIIYLIMRYIRRREGIDLSLTFKELPPE